MKAYDKCAFLRVRDADGKVTMEEWRSNKEGESWVASKTPAGVEDNADTTDEWKSITGTLVELTASERAIRARVGLLEVLMLMFAFAIIVWCFCR